MGPLVSLTHRDKVAAYVDLAGEEGSPMLVALPFDDEADVIAQGNDTVFGLAAGI